MQQQRPGAGGFGGARPAAPMQAQRPQLSAAPMGQPRPGGMAQQAAGMMNAFGGTARPQPAAANSWAAAAPKPAGGGYAAAQQQMQRRPQAQQMVGALGGMLASDEDGKTGIKDYNPDDGKTIGDEVEKYALDDDEQKSGGGGGGLMGMLSDRHSKDQIKRLEGANDALTSALSSRAAYPNTSAPSSGLQALGQQSPPPSHASFPDSTQRVAAQNAAMKGGNPFDVGMAQPNLDELDEAYKRLGQAG